MGIDVEDYYRRYGPMVLRRCRHILRSEDEAVDAMQDVFVELLRKQSRLEHRAPSSLLYTMATNVCLNRLRKHRRNREYADDDLISLIAGSDVPEEKALTRHFLDRLFSNEQESTRTIAVLHYVDRLTLEETADHVGLSVSGVRKRLRGLRKRGLAAKEV